MAGRRRPTRAQRRAERRREALTDRMAAAQTPAARLAAAAEFARATIANLPEAVAGQLADELARELIQAADRAMAGR